MSRFSRSASVAALLILSANVAQALTAEELWASWQESATAAGLFLTAEEESLEGETLTLSGVTLSDGGSAESPVTAFEAIIDEIVLIEGEDGSVVIVPTGDLQVAMGDAAAGAGGTVTVAHVGSELIATNDAEGTSYSVVALDVQATAAFSSVSPMSSDPAAPQLATTEVVFGFAELEALVDDVAGDNRSVLVDLTALEMGYDVKSADAAMEQKSVQTSSTKDVALTAEFVMPKTLALAALTTPAAWATALAEGMALSVELTSGENSGSMKDENAFAPMDLTYVGQPGETGISMDAEGFVVESTGAGAAISVTSAMLPFPKLDIAIGPMVIDMWMPVMAAAEADEFGLTFKLADVTVNEEAWATIDPGKSLPRDPLQLAIDASGTAKLDLFAMAAADAGGMTAVTPPQPETLTITELSLKAAGAALAGTGAFTFDNATGMPVPAGEANVTVQGANGLIDKLIALGLLTEADAGGARMMLAMFMAPASGPDDLTSKIEAKADGSIFVNGQQVQ